MWPMPVITKLKGWFVLITLALTLAAVPLVATLYFDFPSIPVWASRPEQQSEPQHLRFKWAGSGRAVKKGAPTVSFGRYKSEDGILVERSVETYRSDNEASAALNGLSKSASEVILWNDKTDADSHRVGRRVELLFEKSAGEPQQTVVAWEDGRRMFVLRSGSRRHVLDFEQQDYPAVRPKAVSPRP